MSLWDRGLKTLHRLTGQKSRSGESFSQVPWLDREDREVAIERRLRSGTLTEEQAGWCRSFAKDGYLIFPRLIPEDQIDHVWG